MNHDYKYKYEKYKRKYMKAKKSQNSESIGIEDAVTISDLYDSFEKRLKTENFDESLVKSVTTLLKKNTLGDEWQHMLEDVLMMQFIAAIAKNKITDIKSIQNIAQLIKEVNEIPYNKWFS